MRVGFFVEKWGVVSETFITDLIEGISSNAEFDVTIISSETEELGSKSSLKVLTIPFYTLGSKYFVYLEKLLQFFGNRNWIGNIRLSTSYRSLNQKAAGIKMDVAYIDFGQTAILIREYLVHQKIPFIVHFHGKDATQLMSDHFYTSEIKKIFQDAFVILVASHHIKRRLILEGCPASKIRLIRYGVNINKIGKKNSFSSKPNSFIHVGRLIEKKNPIATIYAFKIVHDKNTFVRLTIAGTGPLFNKCKKLVSQLGLDGKVFLIGSIDHEEVLKEYAKHDIYVQHSVSSSRGDQEGFALSLTEAMCAGLPVVSTLHNGIPENVVDGETGYLVTEYDYERMADRMIQLVEHPEIVKEFGQSGQKRVAKYFDQKSRIHNISNLLEELVNG